jgi:hypothetical protein
MPKPNKQIQLALPASAATVPLPHITRTTSLMAVSSLIEQRKPFALGTHSLGIHANSLALVPVKYKPCLSPHLFDVTAREFAEGFSSAKWNNVEHLLASELLKRGIFKPKG